jgi:hypothetical protein
LVKAALFQHGFKGNALQLLVLSQLLVIPHAAPVAPHPRNRTELLTGIEWRRNRGTLIAAIL